MTAPREPGWYADPEHPATLQRRWDGDDWTDDSRPTGYVTQPGGPPPATPDAVGSPVFGAAPAPSGDPAGPRRRMTAAVVATSVAAALVLVAVLLALLGVL